jgi:hypothetical protein
MSTLSIVCSCAACPGSDCRCGCQDRAAASCQCGETCNCGPTCTCKGCRDAHARQPERR